MTESKQRGRVSALVCVCVRTHVCQEREGWRKMDRWGKVEGRRRKKTKVQLTCKGWIDLHDLCRREKKGTVILHKKDIQTDTMMTHMHTHLFRGQDRCMQRSTPASAYVKLVYIHPHLHEQL